MLPRHQFTYLGASKTLYRRAPGPESPWYLDFQHAGQIHKHNLRTHKLDGPLGAVARAKQLVDATRTGKLQDYLAALRGETKPQTPNPKPQTPLSDLLSAFDRLPNASPHYIFAASAVCRRVLGDAAVCTAGKFDPARVPLTHFTRDFVAEYRAKSHQLAEDAEDEETGESILRTANSYLTNFRALFSENRQEEYVRRFKLILPDTLPGFLAAPRLDAPAKEYAIPDDATIAQTFLALSTLAETDPNAHTAIWLALGAGMRKSEIAACTTDWFITLAGQRHIRLKMRTKNGSRNVDVPLTNGAEPHLDAAIQRALATSATQDSRPKTQDSPHLLIGTQEERTTSVFARISSWMAALGWHTQKRIHEFRAFGGCQVAQRDGLLAARDWCRHSSQQTTERYYGRYIKTRITVAPIQLHHEPANIVTLPESIPSIATRERK